MFALMLFHRVRGLMHRDSAGRGANGEAPRQDPRFGGWRDVLFASEPPQLSEVDRYEAEETLASARLVVALVYASLRAPGEPAYAALLAYVAYAAGILIVLRRGRDVSRALQVAVHAVDLFVPVALGFVITRPGEFPSALYLVPLVGAAMRWGGAATLASLAVAMVVALQLVTRPSTFPLAPDAIAAALLIAGILLAFVGLLEQRRRVQIAAITSLRERCQTARGFKSSLLLILEGLTELFRARGARVIVHDTRSNRTFLWEFTPSLAPDKSLRCTETAGAPSLHSSPPLNGQLVEDRLTATLLAAEWSGHLELLEPAAGSRSAGAVRFLERAVREVTPALYNGYLVSHIRSRAARRERARLARELHDGAIQSLIGAEMQIDALCRRVGLDGRANRIGVELKDVQSILHLEILSLRELMVRMKPLDVTPDELPEYLSLVVNRFSRDSGMRGDFVADGPPLGPARQHCVELARILQEALANARKHSGATSVQVSLRSSVEAVWLVIEDNGRGFAFEGRRTITEPGLLITAGGTPAVDSRSKSDQHPSPPRVPEALRESVRALGGQLVIDSKPGLGARLEIMVPATSGLATAHTIQRVAS